MGKKNVSEGNPEKSLSRSDDKGKIISDEGPKPLKGVGSRMSIIGPVDWQKKQKKNKIL